MKAALRAGAILIALAGVIDPEVALQRRAPVPIELLLPPTHDPTFVEADRVRASLVTLLGDWLDADSSEPPRAMVTLGNAIPPDAVTVPVLSVSIDAPRLSAVAVDDAHASEGQKQLRLARFEGHGLNGRSTEFVLRRGEARVGATTHRWSQDDETFEARFEFIPPAAGLNGLRITAATEGIAPVTLDLPVLVSPRKLRVLMYEPRPSWSASFVRMALESDPAFDVRSLTTTSKGIATATPRAPASLAAVDHDIFDAIAVGGLDLLTAADLVVLDRFASIRGGTVILLPDARLPGRVGTGFELPTFDEVLIDRPVGVQSTVGTLRASEFLLPRSGGTNYRPLATVAHAGAQRAAVGVTTRGEGQVIVCGLLDGWRYRGEKEGAFAHFWRGTIADGASAAAARLSVRVEPVISPPAHAVRIRATVRRSEWTQESGAIRLPSLRAALIAEDGQAQMIRLWPAAVPGVYEGSMVALHEGRYTARVVGSGIAAETPLVISRAATPVTPDHSRALARLARSSGGGAFDSGQLPAIIARLQQTEAARVTRRLHPMRSGWWIVPFAVLLGTEWALRRRQGLR